MPSVRRRLQAPTHAAQRYTTSPSSTLAATASAVDYITDSEDDQRAPSRSTPDATARAAEYIIISDDDEAEAPRHNSNVAAPPTSARGAAAPPGVEYMNYSDDEGAETLVPDNNALAPPTTAPAATVPGVELMNYSDDDAVEALVPEKHDSNELSLFVSEDEAEPAKKGDAGELPLFVSEDEAEPTKEGGRDEMEVFDTANAKTATRTPTRSIRSAKAKASQDNGGMTNAENTEPSAPNLRPKRAGKAKDPFAPPPLDNGDRNDSERTSAGDAELAAPTTPPKRSRKAKTSHPKPSLAPVPLLITNGNDTEVTNVENPEAPTRSLRPKRGAKTTTSQDEPAPSPGPAPLDLDDSDDMFDTTDGILCVCSNRTEKPRTNLGLCDECDLLLHYNCAVRTKSAVEGFTCFKCPNGKVNKVADRAVDSIVSKKVMASLKSGRMQAPYKVARTAVKAKTAEALKVAGQKRKSVVFGEAEGMDVNNVSKAAGQKKRKSVADAESEWMDLNGVSSQMVQKSSPRRQGLRIKITPKTSNPPTPTTTKSESNQPIPTTTKSTSKHPARAATKAQPQPQPPPAVDPVAAGYSGMINGLLRIAERKPRKDSRTYNLHEIFLHKVPIEHIWVYYCSQPDSSTTTQAVRRPTKTHFTSHGIEPVEHAPVAWSNELKHRLGLMLDAARNDKQRVYLEPGLWQKDVGMALKHLSDIATEVMYRGSYKGKRAKLGLLAEILGFSGKGAFWKGGEDFPGKSEAGKALEAARAEGEG